jgi:hypothetical protein
MTALAWLTGSDVSHTCEKALDERGNCLLDQGSKATTAARQLVRPCLYCHWAVSGTPASAAPSPPNQDQLWAGEAGDSGDGEVSGEKPAKLPSPHRGQGW